MKFDFEKSKDIDFQALLDLAKAKHANLVKETRELQYEPEAAAYLKGLQDDWLYWLEQNINENGLTMTSSQSGEPIAIYACLAGEDN